MVKLMLRSDPEIISIEDSYIVKLGVIPIFLAYG